MRGILSVAQRTGESVLTRTCIDASSGKIRKDILPILPNPKEAKRRGKRILEMFLPVGYPHTVHPNYPWFSWWNFVQTFTGSVAGVLATQSLLYGLGVTKTAGQAAPLAATLNWILKDGLGQLGGIFFVGAIGHRFDVEAKRYRMIAAICMVFATLAELLVPILMVFALGSRCECPEECLLDGHLGHPCTDTAAPLWSTGQSRGYGWEGCLTEHPRQSPWDGCGGLGVC